jgi:hypothetical protein
MAEGLPISLPAIAKSFVRQPVDSQLPSCLMEDYKADYHMEERRVRRLADHYGNSFTRHPIGMPNS